MSMKPSQALLAVLAVIAGPAFAQDATAPAGDAPAADAAATEAPAADAPAAEAPATEAPAGQAPAAGDAAAPTEAGQPAAEAAAPTEPQPGQYYVKESHQDWTIRCIKNPNGNDPCELYQLLKDGSGNSVAEMTLIPLSGGEVAAGATLVAPLETDLVKGLGFAVDGAQARGYPFSFCAPVGCVSRMGFTTAELAALKRGNKASVTLMPFGGDPKNPVNLALSLSGFTAGFDALSKMAAEAKPAE